ncbi:MAG TPA: methyltransferase domain-containing protein [Albitalea sp.]|nr:methyltransferase domain-containing protein [Albitalea sp.]
MPSVPDRHLDLGCGISPRNPYARRELCGVDIRALESTAQAEFRCANVVLDPIPYPDNHFGSVSAYDFIEHVPRLLTTPDGRATWFPFVSLMNEIWRVLAPGGRLYALTPAYPSQSAFVDPTHVNIISEHSHEYFCGDKPIGQIYGFEGAFNAVRTEWVVYLDALVPTELTLRQRLRRWNRRRANKLTHFLWELEAAK